MARERQTMHEPGPEVRRADPVARRKAILLVILGALAGTLSIAGFEHYRAPLRDWLASNPGERTNRIKLLLILVAAGLSAPLVALAAYLWSLGSSVVRTRQFPPPGSRVIRDTPVVAGQAAMVRGRSLKALALFLGAASALLWLFLWRLHLIR
jgi:hypothetical protein